MLRKCLTAAVLAIALVGTMTVPASAAVAAPDAPAVTNAEQVRIESTWLGPNVYFWGHEAKNAGALAIMAGAGAVAAGCGFIKPTSPGGVAAKILCGGISAPALLLVGRRVNEILNANPAAASWCFKVGPINKFTSSIVPKLVVTSLKIVGREHCR